MSSNRDHENYNNIQLMQQKPGTKSVHLTKLCQRGHVHMMSAQGGGGGILKADVVRKPSKAGCVKMQTGGVVKKLCRRHIYMAPKTNPGASLINI